jgi:hypothetical protein
MERFRASGGERPDESQRQLEMQLLLALRGQANPSPPSSIGAFGGIMN